MSIDQALLAATARLHGERLDAEVLLMHVLDCSRAKLYAHREQPVTQARLERFEALIERRARGEPVAYLLGRREFWSLDLRLSPATLIPRPETEHLVERALELGSHIVTQRVVDLGTGCGAVALALASERPGWQIAATDSSPEALRLAADNAERLGIDNVTFHLGDWLAAVPTWRFDLVVSNPPYLAHRDPHLQRGDVRFEPRRALVAGVDGMESIRSVATGARAHLESGGAVVLEHGPAQGRAVRDLLADLGYRAIDTRPDHAGHERVTSACWTKEVVSKPGSTPRPAGC